MWFKTRAEHGERGGQQWRVMEDCSTDERLQQETLCRPQRTPWWFLGRCADNIIHLKDHFRAFKMTAENMHQRVAVLESREQISKTRPKPGTCSLRTWRCKKTDYTDYDTCFSSDMLCWPTSSSPTPRTWITRLRTVFLKWLNWLYICTHVLIIYGRLSVLF